MRFLVCHTCFNTVPAAWANGFLTSAIALGAQLSTPLCTTNSMHHKAVSCLFGPSLLHILHQHQASMQSMYELRKPRVPWKSVRSSAPPPKQSCSLLHKSEGHFLGPSCLLLGRSEACRAAAAASPQRLLRRLAHCLQSQRAQAQREAGSQSCLGGLLD